MGAAEEIPLRFASKPSAPESKMACVTRQRYAARLDSAANRHEYAGGSIVDDGGDENP